MASLTPLNEALGKRRTKHLLRRATFNYSKTQIDVFALLTPTEVVNALLVDNTNTLSEPYHPSYGNWTTLAQVSTGTTAKRSNICGWWWYNAINDISLKHKLTFFLHTSFTVG